MDATTSNDASVYTSIKPTRRHIPQDGILHSHRRENLKSYIMFTLRYVKFEVEKKLLEGTKEETFEFKFHQKHSFSPTEKHSAQELMRNMPENGDATSRQVSDISLCI
jgi:hypothetical protein